uniref:Ig-like domain-containing protein n=1 Tax=Fundulus heteroclitus TaxID=8078 RepID=A0A3Q2TYL9_FUNHE
PSTAVFFSGVLPKPNITVQPAGLVSWGQTASITCLITNGLKGSFNFTKTPGPFSLNVISSTNTATFQIPQVLSFEDEGVYQCKFQSTISGTDFSDQAHLNLTGNYSSFSLNTVDLFRYSRGSMENLTASKVKAASGFFSGVTLKEAEYTCTPRFLDFYLRKSA